MKITSLTLLEKDWDALLADKNWLDMGKCLRAIVKIHKNAGALSHNAYDIGQRVKVLEKNLNACEPRARFAIIGDILYCLRAIDSSSTEEFGAAFAKTNSKSGKRRGPLAAGPQD